MAIAYTAVWAAETFNLAPGGVAFMYVVSGCAGALGNPLLGLLSDRIGWRRPFIVGQLLIASLIYSLYPFATRYEEGLALVAFAGFGVMGMTLASVGDRVRGLPGLAPGAGLRILATERTAWAMGIILGPALGAVLVTITDSVGPIFLTTAAIQVAAAALAMTGPEVRGGGGPHSASGAESDWPARRRVGLVLLVASLILLTLPAQTRNTYLPLFITQVLNEPRGAVGPAFTINAMMAVLVMPQMGGLAGRFGAGTVLYLGAIAGIIYTALQSMSTSYATTLGNQLLIGISISLWSTASLIFLQQLLPGRAGIAGGLYLTIFQVTPIVAGLVLGPVADRWGIPAAFSTTSMLVAASMLLLAVAARLLRSSANTARFHSR